MRLVVLLICVFFVPLPLQAETLPETLAFADYLAAQGDHFRAVTEYQRFLFTQPQSPVAARARYALAEELVVLKNWEQADKTLRELLLLHPDSFEARQSLQLLADSAYQRGAFGLARQRYRLLLALPEKSTQDYAHRRIGWTFLEQDQPRLALQSFRLLPAAEQESFAQALAGYEALDLKSPRLAATLSAVVPGSGQLYVGRVRQAALAFGLNGIFILGTIEALQHENYVVGGILAFLELGWYGGNIYNASNNAHKQNQRLKAGYRQQMKADLSLRLGWLQGQPGVLITGQF